MRALVAWSGGKDCTLAMCIARRRGAEIAGLVWVRGGVTRHVRSTIEEQAASMGLPLTSVLPSDESDRLDKMRSVLRAAERDDGVDLLVTGHIRPDETAVSRLESYAEGTKIQIVSPLRQTPRTSSIARTIIDEGIRARVFNFSLLSVEGAWSPLGRDFDRGFVDEAIAMGCDPCGERGEFDTLVYDAPFFSRKIDSVADDSVLSSLSQG